jgi:hypothetical protein
MAFRRASKTKKWQKSRLNLHVTISEGKPIGSNPKKRSKNESSRKAQGLFVDDSRADDSSC